MSSLLALSPDRVVILKVKRGNDGRISCTSDGFSAAIEADSRAFRHKVLFPQDSLMTPSGFPRVSLKRCLRRRNSPPSLAEKEMPTMSCARGFTPIEQRYFVTAARGYPTHGPRGSQVIAGRLQVARREKTRRLSQ